MPNGITKPISITKAEFCRLITSSPSTFLGTTRGIVDSDCIDLSGILDPTHFTEIREAHVRSRDIVFTGGSHLGIVKRNFYRYNISGNIVVACAFPENKGICCYYLLRN